MRIMATDEHPAAKVDPFGRLPCDHPSVLVHITDAESMGEDLVECRPCGYAMRLADLYRGLFPEGGPPIVPPDPATAPAPAKKKTAKKKTAKKKTAKKKTSAKPAARKKLGKATGKKKASKAAKKAK